MSKKSNDRTRGRTARRKAVASPQAMVDLRAKAVDPRTETVGRREEAADLRELAAEVREEAAALRERALRPQEQAVRATAARNALTESDLREANEHLVVATVEAQTTTDAAVGASVRLSYIAEHDFLTGLPNRSLLSDRLAQAIALARRLGKKVALFYLDLDHFKHINDSLGHEVGDQLLQSAALRLQAGVRLSDTVSRQGGDEFVVLLPQLEDVQGAVHAAQKLVEAMAQPHVLGPHRLTVGVSIGISVYPDDALDVEGMVRNADTAMYHAKNNGRGSCKLFTPDLDGRAVARQTVELALSEALEQHRFVLHYQPKIAMGESLNQRVVAEGIETTEQMAFLRLHHCAEGQGEFFCEPLAAESFAAVLASGRL